MRWLVIFKDRKYFIFILVLDNIFLCSCRLDHIICKNLPGKINQQYHFQMIIKLPNIKSSTNYLLLKIIYEIQQHQNSNGLLSDFIRKISINTCQGHWYSLLISIASLLHQYRGNQFCQVTIIQETISIFHLNLH